MAAASAPIAIGTRGTVGSLLKKEIEYFTQGKPHGRQQQQMVEIDNCRSSPSRPASWFLITGWKRKKRRCSSNNSNTCFLPSMCSAIEVSDKNRFDKLPGFSYRILKNDVHNFHV